MSNAENRKPLRQIAGMAIALVAALVVLQSCAGLFGRNNDPVVATVNGMEIRASDVRYGLRQVEVSVATEFFQAHPDASLDENVIFRDGKTLGRILREEAVRYVALYKLHAEYARSNFDITVPDAVVQEVREEIEIARTEMGDADFYEFLSMQGVADSEYLEWIFGIWYVVDELLFTIRNTPEAFARFERYVEGGIEPVCVDTLQARAEEIWARAIDGEDFDMLIALYGEDPEMANAPDGYTWAVGMMLQEFEDATRLLEVGEISPVVPTQFGFHIIMRVESDYENILRSPWVPEYEGEEILAAKHVLIRIPDSREDDERAFRAIMEGLERMFDDADVVFLPALDNVPVDM